MMILQCKNSVAEQKPIPFYRFICHKTLFFETKNKIYFAPKCMYQDSYQIYVLLSKIYNK